VYEVTIALLDGQTAHVHDTRSSAVTLRVRQEGSDVGMVRVAHRWECQDDNGSHPPLTNGARE
jgi:hypothetical protein